MIKKKILILGVTGMLGHILFTYLSKKKNFNVYGTCSKNSNFLLKKNSFLKKLNKNIFLTHDDLFGSSLNIIKDFRPNYIINCIGVIKQSSLIDDLPHTLLINSIFPKFLSTNSNIYNYKLILISTDCVYDGKKGYYKERDIPNSNDLYGLSKLNGEITDNKNVLTIRTSIIGPEIKTYKGLFSWLISQKRSVFGYKKVFFSGLTTLHLSQVIEKILIHPKNISGLYNISAKKISKYDLLNKIIKIYKLNLKIFPKLSPVLDRSLNSIRFKKKLNISIETWDQMIKNQKDYYQDLSQK
tara:strand:- start:85 stop:978 length:894 start_codon:yes stop_codon:yes gene_type:complete